MQIICFCIHGKSFETKVGQLGSLWPSHPMYSFLLFYELQVVKNLRDSEAPFMMDDHNEPLQQLFSGKKQATINSYDAFGFLGVAFLNILAIKKCGILWRSEVLFGCQRPREEPFQVSSQGSDDGGTSQAFNVGAQFLDIHMNKNVWVQEMVIFLRIFRVTPELNDGL